MVERTDALLDHVPTRGEPLNLACGVQTEADMIETDGMRPIVEAVDRGMSRLRDRALSSDADAAALLSSWDALVAFLALGPAPELRPCPFCGSLGMRAATRCGVCWKRLDAG